MAKKAEMSIQELARMIQDTEKAKRDLITPLNNLQMVVGELHEGERTRKYPMLGLNERPESFKSDLLLNIRPIAHDNLGQRLNIPAKYYDRMLADSPELLAKNVNHWLAKQEKNALVRCLHGDVRAILSDRYRPLDNALIIAAAMPALSANNCMVTSCSLTESHMYLQAITPRLEGEVKKGDMVQAGITLSNSEVGRGSVKVEPTIWRLVCANGMVVAKAFKRYHVGSRLEVDEASLEVIYTRETIEADMTSFRLKVRDVVAHSFNEIAFQETLEIMRASADQKIEAGAVAHSVDKTKEMLSLTDKEAELTLSFLIENGDLSQWGLANAITRTAQEVESYDRAIELERLGGQVIDLPKSAWKEVANG